MDIRACLEAEHSKTATNTIVKYIGDDPLKFRVLVEQFLKGEAILRQRAAWPLSYVAIEHPELIKPYFGKLMDELGKKGLHPAIHRSILRVFQQIDIPEKYQGQLIDICYRFIMNETLPPAIRAFAITTATNICMDYPELKNELLIILKELSILPQQPAIKSRIKSALKALQNPNSKI